MQITLGGDLGSHEKHTELVYRPNAKFPWLISQRNNEVKLSDDQMVLIARTVLRNAGIRV